MTRRQTSRDALFISASLCQQRERYESIERLSEESARRELPSQRQRCRHGGDKSERCSPAASARSRRLLRLPPQVVRVGGARGGNGGGDQMPVLVGSERSGRQSKPLRKRANLTSETVRAVKHGWNGVRGACDKRRVAESLKRRGKARALGRALSSQGRGMRCSRILKYPAMILRLMFSLN